MQASHKSRPLEPLISVITPTFNRAAYLPTAVASVLAQSYGRFEHWIIDDGSTDETRQALAPLLEDPRIRFVAGGANKGPSHARNIGLERAKGVFVCFLDSDDCWLPHKLERSLQAFAEDPDASVVYADYLFIDGAGEALPARNMPRYSGRVVPQMLRDNCVSMNTTMARRECFSELGGFDPKRRLAGDYELWLRFAAYYRFHYIAEPLGYYRLMSEQISTDKLARIANNEEILREFFERHGHRVTKREAREGWAFFLGRKARRLAAEGQSGQAIAASLRAVRWSPNRRFTYRALARVLRDVALPRSP